MKIAHLVDSLKTGGAQKLLVTFSRQAQAWDKGFPISVSVISLRADGDSPMAGELVQAGAQIAALPGKGLFDPTRFLRLIQLLRRERFDILQSHLSYSNILAGISRRLVSVPVICTLHNAAWDPRHTRAFRQWLEYWILRTQAQRVVAVGEAVAAAHQDRIPPQRLKMIANATSLPVRLSVEEREGIRKELTCGSGGPLLISVGRLSPQKGYSDLLQAFAQVSARYPEARLVIAGDGSLREALSAQISQLGIQERACLLGNRQDVPSLLAASDLYVSGSHFEGLPVAALEAMSAGLPVVATQVGDLPGVVVPGTGLLVPPQQPSQLAQAISSLLEDTNRRTEYSQAARRHAEANFSASNWFDKYMSLYQEVIQENSRRAR